MNELIEQMMLEATKDMPSGYYVPPQYWEKFAVLIVRECAKVSFKTDMACSIGQWGSTDAILRHFGQEGDMDSIVSEWKKSRVK